ncbi:MAG TPA: molybdopterin-dependent oxidoreductase [Thermoanaerobaculia bacterium]|nr:molybdopterin-dependent oxidoreductase [Thermoanaerobaculia bacterium]
MNPSLPPGQRETAAFPRFGLRHFARRFPSQTSKPVLQITGLVSNELSLEDPLAHLPRVEQTSDFHCVTTWSRRSLRWGGVRFVDFFETVLKPRAFPDAAATLVALRGQDGARTALPLEDLLSPDVLLADTLDGMPLDIDHGAPLRLVAPQHYGYKSVKHLSRIELRLPASGYRVSALKLMDHPRARAAQEERGRFFFPGWLLRYLYKPLIRSTVALFEEASRERKVKAGG